MSGLEKMSRGFRRNWPMAMTWLGLLVSGCSTLPQSSQVFEHQETVIGDWKESYTGDALERDYRIYQRESGYYVADIVKSTGRFHVESNGVFGPEFDEIIRRQLFPFDNTCEYSNDGRHFAYLGRNQNKLQYVIDNKVQPEFENPFTGPDGQNPYSGTALFSPDGNHFRYTVFNATISPPGYHLIVDGKEVAPIGTKSTEVVFSDDGKRVAFILNNANKSNVVLDGVGGPEFDEIDQAHFSIDDQQFIYRGRNGEKARAIINGAVGPEFDHVYFVEWSDGNTVEPVAYVGENDDKDQIVIDGKATPLNAQIDNHIVSPDHRRVAYSLRQGDKLQLRLDDWSTPLYDDIEFMNFSEDGRVFICIVRQASKRFLLTIGKSGPKLEEVNWAAAYPELSQNGEHYFYTLNYNKPQVVVLDSRPGPKFDLVDYVTPSPDLKYVAYIATHFGDKHLIVQSKGGLEYLDGDSPIFSADGKNFAYECNDRIIVDGQPGPKFEEIERGPMVCMDGRLEYIAVEKQAGGLKLVRVDVPGFSPPNPHGIYLMESSQIVY